MKTSNKIIIATIACVIIGQFLYSYLLRIEYQKAMANPISASIKIDFKEAKFLNISHIKNVNFKEGGQFQIELQQLYKDSLRYNYINDSLNLDATRAGEITIITPKLPFLKIKKDLEKAQMADKENYEILYEENAKPVYIYFNFKSGNINIQLEKPIFVILDKCKLENVDIKGITNMKLKIEESEITKLNLNLPKHSEIMVNYSNILAKNFNLADSCSVTISGNKALNKLLK